MGAEHQRWKNIQKAYPFEEKRLAKWKPPFIVQPKYDGVRCRAIPLSTPDGNNYVLVSSEENIIYSVPHINEVLSKLKLKAELDGELYCHGMSFEEILSITSRTVNLHPDYLKIQFHIFDIVNEEPQMRRQLLVEALRGVHTWLQVAPFWLCTNLDEIKETYDGLIKLKYEGIIVRNIYAPYLKKRSIWVMKFKPKRQDTYQIVGWQEEISQEGIPKGRIGALIMQSQTGDTFGVSAGLDNQKKAELWDVKDTLAGRKAIVHYQHLTDRQLPKGTFNIEVLEA